jgi:hypothetical protein
MFVSCTLFVLSVRGLCDGPIPCPEEFYRLWCVFECDQVKIKTLYIYCEEGGRRGKDYERINQSGSYNILVYLSACLSSADMLQFDCEHCFSDLHCSTFPLDQVSRARFQA